MGLQELKAQLKETLGPSKTSKKQYKEEVQIEEVYHRADWQDIEVDFLNSYYSQDGNNASVTGGIGTEQLTDFTQKIILSIPTSPKLKLKADAAYDYYSSASTDNIDNIRSSDSSSDVRAQLGFGLEYKNSKNWTSDARIGLSSEYDYTSFHAGGGLSFRSDDGNRQIGLSGQAFYDTWIPFYPSELRGEVAVPTNKRQSYNLSLGFQQVLNQKLQASIMLETTYMKGLLSTPFHRVFFQDTDRPDIERLPDQRWKIPIGTRLNYHLHEKIVFRSYYRFYYDSWGMSGHTASIELPIKINRFLAIYPHYRFHTQTAIQHFQPYQEHLSTSEFYTSDFDLSALNSQTYGIGLLYSPPNGIAKVNFPLMENRALRLEAIDLKASIFSRSTGLSAFIISVGAKVKF